MGLSEYLYCVEINDQVFQLLYSIMNQTLECNNISEETKAYVLIACIRLFKINIYELITSGTKEEKAGT